MTESTDLASGEVGADEISADGPDARTPRAWVHGGSSTRRWDWSLVAWCLVGFGAGVLVGAMLTEVTGNAGPSQAALWIGMAVPVVYAFTRSVPRGLLRFRWLDVLYGIVLGIVLRFVQGALAVASGAPAALPSVATLDGSLPLSYWAGEFAVAAVVAPVVEEFFFRGVLLVALYSAVRRFAGGGTAGARIAGGVAVIGSTGLFVLAHVLIAPIAASDVIALTLLGLVNGALVLFTRRIWAAVLVHVVYNGMLVALTFVGTVWG